MILHPEPDDPEPVEQVEHVMTYYETVSAAYWLARRVETLKQEIGNG